MMNSNLLRMTSIVLADVLSNTGPADVKLGLFFKQHRDLGTKDRAFARAKSGNECNGKRVS